LCRWRERCFLPLSEASPGRLFERGDDIAVFSSKPTGRQMRIPIAITAK
jgi:hypothetical protein